MFEFRHLSLFSICLHFLRCVRSCDKQNGYFHVCSRVREKNFMECNVFQSLPLTSHGTFLGLDNNNRIGLDVFLSKEVPYTFNNNKCCNFQYFSYPQELFACFSSIMLRMFLNCIVIFFSNLLLSVSLHDEKKIVILFWDMLIISLIGFGMNQIFNIFMNSLISLRKLIVVRVLKTKINKILVLITFTVAHWRLNITNLIGSIFYLSIFLLTFFDIAKMSVKKVAIQLEKEINLNFPHYNTKFFANRQNFLFILDWIVLYFHLLIINDFLMK